MTNLPQLIIAAKMFTTGRLMFASVFIISFVLMMVYSYKKDAKNNKNHYQNAAIYVAIGIVLTIGLLFLSKYLINR